MGMQFFDVAVYAIGSGGMCLVVYRGLQGDTFGRIWDYANPPLSSATEVILASLVGVVAGGVGLVFRRCAFPLPCEASCALCSWNLSGSELWSPLWYADTRLVFRIFKSFCIS